MNGGVARLAPAAMVTAFASIPLYPSFITLTSVSFPGISVLPHAAAVALLLVPVLFAAWSIPAVLAPPRTGSPMGRAIAIFWCACLLAVALGFNPRDGAIFLLIFGISALWHVAILRFYDAPRVARTIWWSLLLPGLIASALAIAMVVTRIPASQYAIANGRAVGTFVLPGELAGYLIVLIPAAYGIANVAGSRALRFCAWAAFAVGLLALALTFSRAGWMGFAAAAAIFAALRARGLRAGLVTAGAVVAVALLLVLVLFNEHHNPSENYTRLSIWQAAIGAIDRFPLTGVGPFGFLRVYPAVRLPGGDATAFHAHSLYLTFFAEIGIVGLTAFGWLIWSFARSVRDALRAAEPRAALLAAAVAAGVAGTLVQGLIDTVSVVIFSLLLPTMALALATARSGGAGA